MKDHPLSPCTVSLFDSKNTVLHETTHGRPSPWTMPDLRWSTVGARMTTRGGSTITQQAFAPVVREESS